jgi:hypothetical protein
MRRTSGLAHVLFALLLAAAAACAGRAIDPPISAGSDAAAAQSGAGGGPSGPSPGPGYGGFGGVSPLPAQGAAMIVFANRDPSATGIDQPCPVPHTSVAPILVAGSTATSSTAKGTEAVDGVSGNQVSCAVVASPGGYAVSARIRSDISASQRWAQIVIGNLTIGAGQSNIPGTLSVLDNVTQNAYGPPNSTPCMFSVTGAALGVAAGKIWGSVTCAILVDPGNASGDQCKATGYFIFENCAR